MVSELWSGHEKLTDGWTDGQTDGRTDGGHDIIRPVFDGRNKRTHKTFNALTCFFQQEL